MKRSFILAAVLLTALSTPTYARAGWFRHAETKPDLKISSVEHLSAGKFEWEPDRCKSGGLGVLVSLPRQMLYVYRGSVLIARSSISSGRPGHTTPSGLFPILGKEVMHHSNLYDNAPMPWMQRLTMEGVALHAGYLPGEPASHGCIRLPYDFARLLFDITSCGDPVLVVGKYGDIVKGSGDEMPPLLASAVTSTPGNALPSQVKTSAPVLPPVVPVAIVKPSPTPTAPQSSKSMAQLEEEELAIRKDPSLDRAARTSALLQVWSQQRALMGAR
jgi:L,D-transpeptidase catalytic domain